MLPADHVVDKQTSKCRPNLSRTLLYNTHNNPMDTRCSKYYQQRCSLGLQLHQGSSYGSGDQRLHWFSSVDTLKLWQKALCEYYIIGEHHADKVACSIQQLYDRKAGYPERWEWTHFSYLCIWNAASILRHRHWSLALTAFSHR